MQLPVCLVRERVGEEIQDHGHQPSVIHDGRDEVLFKVLLDARLIIAHVCAQDALLRLRHSLLTAAEDLLSEP